MNTRSAEYTDIDRHGEAAGVAMISHPFSELWPQIEDRFFRKVVQLLSKSRMPANPGRLLEQAQLGNDAVMLAEWFIDYEPPKVELQRDSVEGLRELASRTEDLARDNGQWLEDARELDRPAEQAIVDLRLRLEALAGTASAAYGPQVARETLEFVRRQLHQSAANVRQPERWTIDHTTRVQRHARTLRGLAHPHNAIKRMLAKLRPKTTLRVVLSDEERSIIEHQILPEIQRAARLRFDHERQKRFQYVLETILGRPAVRGILDEVIAELDREIEFFRNTARLSHLAQHSSRTTGLHEIRLAENLDDVIDPQRGRTLAHLYSEAIKRSGCTARELADQIRQQGLTVRGRLYPASDWRTCLKPAEAFAALKGRVTEYLGSANPQSPLNIEEPRTAFEHAASITLLHPALRRRLASLLPVWTRHSLPYADVHPIRGAEPQVHRFLYCYPSHRHWWEKLLRSKVTIANPMSATGTLDAYATGHPYIAILVQHALAVPLGALRSLPACTTQGNLLRRTKAHNSLFDRHDYTEVRLLPFRPSDYSDSEKLFEAGLKAKLIHPVPGTDVPRRYAMTNLTAGLNGIFSPDLLKPDVLTDQVFHDALRDRGFREFVTLTFEHSNDFHQIADQLAQEHDSHKVAQQLTQRGILIAAAPGHYRLNVFAQSGGHDVPESLFQRCRGPLLGLPKDDFVSELNRNDALYQILFWRVADSLQLRQLSPNDVPDFLHSFVSCA